MESALNTHYSFSHILQNFDEKRIQHHLANGLSEHSNIRTFIVNRAYHSKYLRVYLINNFSKLFFQMPHTHVHHLNS